MIELTFETFEAAQPVVFQIQKSALNLDD